MMDALADYSFSLPAFRAAAELGLRVLALATAGFTIGFSIAGVYAARRFRLKGDAAAPASDFPLPPITILKPIKGADNGMYDNLVSFLTQDYPRFQVLFALQNPEDPALGILKELQRNFPSIDMEIIVSKNRIGYNPKVNNLSNACAFVKYDTLLISDSDIRVEKDFLRKTVMPLADAKVGLVTCFYRATGSSGLGGFLEALSVNAQFLPQALVAGHALGLRFAMGAAMLVRRSAFEAIGGFQALRDHLADDFVLGSAIASAGYRVEFSDAIVDSVHGNPSVPEHIAHLARGARTIRACQPLGYAGMFLLQGFALLTTHLALFGPRTSTIALWLATAATRMVAVGWIHASFLSNPAILAQLPLIPLADMVQFAAWLSGFRSRAVLWRGEHYHIHVGGRLVPRDPKTPVAIATTVP